MFCPSCGVATQPGSRFCINCGVSLAGEPGAATDPRPSGFADEPAARRTLPPPTDPTPVGGTPAVMPPAGEHFDIAALDDYLDTGKFMVVEQTTPTAEQIAVTARAGDTGRIPVTTDRLSMVGLDGPPALRLPLMVAAAAAAVVAVATPLVTMVSYRVSGDRTADVVVRANDVSTNVLVAAVVAALALLAGAGLAQRGHRFGAGLAGGAGLALAGLMGWLVGECVAILDTARQGLRAEGVAYRIGTTFGVGVWLAVATIVLGAGVFLISLASVRDQGPRLHPTVGTLGALGALGAVVGPLLPHAGLSLADNFSSDQAIGAGLFWKAYVQFTLQVEHTPVPPITTYLRLVLLVLLAAGGIVGFLLGTRWGVGLAAGSVTAAVWMWFTTALDLGDRPYGVAGGNPGTSAAYVHPVTSVGIGAMLLALVVAGALELRRRSVR